MSAKDNDRDARRLALMLAAILPAIAVGGSAPIESESRAAFLKRFGINPTAAGVLEFLRQQQPSPLRLARIEALIKQLGSGRYDSRERASQGLSALGMAAADSLRDAARHSGDLEICFRAQQLLQKLDHSEQQQLHQELLIAAFEQLTETPTPQATAEILDILPALPDASTRQAACEALWACAVPAQVEQLRTAIRHGSTQQRAAAIPALELVAGEAAVDLLQPFLQDADELPRLSAARALLDRRPRPAVAALLDLLASEDVAHRAQAAWLLQQVSGIPPQRDYSVEFPAAVGQWKAWAAGANRFTPVGRKRLQPSHYGAILLESFAENVAELRTGYHLLLYESTVAAKASVAQGVLQLHGDHEEGDQRLCATSDKLLGLPCFPQAFCVRAKLGGEEAGMGGWHVGVSLGNVKVLFHAGLEGGSFRVERVDDHRFLSDNELMPFTPACGILHNMTMDVRRQPDGSVNVDVMIADGAKSGQRFIRSLTLKKSDVGELRRIGLERSGRSGGAALFGSFAIEQLP